VLRGAGPDVRMVHLAGPYEVVAQRLTARRGHFMPTQLLASQYAVLEPLAPDEPGITLNLEATPDHLADEILRTFGVRPHCAG
jgi:carbohydrate kinase (thermoresistant glucokinase family)